MRFVFDRRLFSLCSLFCAVCVIAPGCATLGGPAPAGVGQRASSNAESVTGSAQSPASNTAQSVAQRQPAESAQFYTVEIRPERRKPKTVQVPWLEGATVQDAVDHVRAHKLFGRMDLSVIRQPDPAHPRRVKMNSKYDPRQRRVVMESDYALYPGDRIVIVEDTATAIEDLIGSLPGAMGRTLSGRR